MTTTEPRTEQEILDRESMDDVDAIAAFNPDPEEVLHACLLYTSPSPRDVEESRMPSSA